MLHWHNSISNINHHLFENLIVFSLELRLCQWILKTDKVQRTASWARKAFFQTWSRIEIHWHNSISNINHYHFKILIVFWTELGLCQWNKKQELRKKNAFSPEEAPFSRIRPEFSFTDTALVPWKTLSKKCERWHFLLKQSMLWKTHNLNCTFSSQFN